MPGISLLLECSLYKITSAARGSRENSKLFEEIAMSGLQVLGEVAVGNVTKLVICSLKQADLVGFVISSDGITL